MKILENQMTFPPCFPLLITRESGLATSEATEYGIKVAVNGTVNNLIVGIELPTPGIYYSFILVPLYTLRKLINLYNVYSFYVLLIMQVL